MKNPHHSWLKVLIFIKANKLPTFLLLLIALAVLPSCNQQDNALIGAWKPKKYVLSSGESKVVDGHIFFDQDQWGVIFFILDDNGDVANASAEGGTYELNGENLIFSHYYNLSDVDKGDSTELSKTLRSSNDIIPEESCRIEIEDDILVIYFPSGNAMIFGKPV